MQQRYTTKTQGNILWLRRNTHRALKQCGEMYAIKQMHENLKFIFSSFLLVWLINEYMFVLLMEYSFVFLCGTQIIFWHDCK